MKNQTKRKRAARIASADMSLLTGLATRLNARPDRLRTGKLGLAWRYLRRFDHFTAWHRGGSHVGRLDYGPMIYQRADGTFAADARSARPAKEAGR